MDRRRTAPRVGLVDRRQNRSRGVHSRDERQTLEARIIATEAACGRIINALRNGDREFVLMSGDGRMAARVELTLVDAGVTGHRFGSVRVAVNWSEGTISSAGRSASLSRTELRLLAALLSGDGRPISRGKLIESVWPRDRVAKSVRANALAVYVCSLRKRLTAIGAANAVITVRGLGYRVAT